MDLLGIDHYATRVGSVGGVESLPGMSGSSRGMSATSFVKKLYEMVNHEDPDILSFTHDGAAFEVRDPKRLENEVLPKYYRHSRFQSFVRQLNFYNFKKVSKERSMWIYKHECFHRDQPALLDKLRRKTSGNKNNGSQGAKKGGPPSPTSVAAAHQHHPHHSGSRPGDRWSELFDERTGHYYYYNHRTGTSQWEPPQLSSSPRSFTSGSTSSSAISSAGGSGSPRGSSDDGGSDASGGDCERYSYGDSPRDDSPSRFDQQHGSYGGSNGCGTRRPQHVEYGLDPDDDNLEFMEQDEQHVRGVSPAPATWSRQSSTSSYTCSTSKMTTKRLLGAAERVKRWKREASVSSFDETEDEGSAMDEDDMIGAGSDEEYIPASEQRRMSRKESTAQLLEGAALQMARLKEEGSCSVSRATSSGGCSPVNKPRIDQSIEMAPALAALALLNLPGGNEEEEKLNDGDWVKLQDLVAKHADALTEQEQQQGTTTVSVASAQLLNFCSRNYPSGRPRQLYQGLEAVLGSKPELSDEFKAYRSALDPSSRMAAQCGLGLLAATSAKQDVDETENNDDNELLLLRDFMAFAVTSMEGVLESLPASPHQEMLHLCIATWRKTAQLYI